MMQSFLSQWLRTFFRRSNVVLLGAAVIAVCAFGLQFKPSLADEVHVIPPPALDEPASKGPETTVLAGGCFWGIQGVFEHVKGVISAVSGYTGGTANTAEYETVATGTTGHAESVKVVFDPQKITYGHLLQIFFSVAHDPTELNRQGPDTGTQYRSAIFPRTVGQAKVAKAYVQQLDRAHIYASPIVTTIEPGKTFYPAEGYHQNFMFDHPNYPYIVINDVPKVKNLKRLFPSDYRSNPVLVAGNG